MDPLSITASLIAVLGIGGKAAGAIYKIAILKGAPDVVLALNNEITDLRLVLTAIQDVLRKQNNDELLPSACRCRYEASVTNSLRHAASKVAELEALHDYLKPFVCRAPSSVKYHKIAWLREQPKIRLMLEDLKTVRLQLVGALSILNLAASFGFEATIKTIQSGIRDLQLQQLAQYQQVQQIDNQRWRDQHHVLRGINDLIGGLQQSQQQAESIREQNTIQREDHLREAVASLLAGQQRLEFKVDAVTAAQIARTAEQNMRGNALSPTAPIGRSDGLSPTPLSNVRLSVAYEQCISSCTCICHRRGVHRTPQRLQGFLGSLFLGYSGIPIVTPACDGPNCTTRARSTLMAMYVFPAWLLARIIQIVMRLSASNGLELNIRLPRVISSSSSIWKVSAQGNIEGIKGLFQQRAGSPFDVDSVNGYTALMYAVDYNHTELCELLLYSGADPYQRNTYNMSAIEIAWIRILSKLVGESTSRQLRALFPAEDWIESQQFSLLHRTVLGLNILNLDDLLASITVSTMNAADACGRTALWWAAQRGDYAALSSLIRYKVDVNRITSSGGNALNAALCSGRQDCARLLLQHVSDLGRYDANGMLPLHYWAYRGLDVDILDTITSSGVDINSRSLRDAGTALTIAAQFNHHSVCEHLIARNANPGVINADNGTALHCALECNSHETIGLLMQSTNHRLRNNAGETLLHYAAQHGDIRTLEILCASGPYDIDVKEKVLSASPRQPLSIKVTGLTAFEIAEARTDVTPEWLAMFRKLHHKIEFPDAGPGMDAVFEEAEEFHDALAFQQL